MTEQKGSRIAKVIAHSGFCSRREAEKLIEEGRVQVNGKTINTPAIIITDQSIKIDNKLITTQQKTRLFAFHKPENVITSTKDEKGRQTVFDLISDKKLPRLMTIGRLDYNTEGLLLLTNNGELARHIELPKTGWIRRYRARVFGKLNEERLKKLEKGIVVNGVKYGAMKVEIQTQTAANSWLEISIKEGKNREIRKIMEEMGLQVNRLIRTSFGPFNLGEIKKGEIIEINSKLMKNGLPKEFL